MFELEDPFEYAINYLKIANHKNNHGDTLFHEIAKLGLANLIPNYIAQGSSLLVRNKENETVLDMALKHNQCEFAEKIIPYFYQAIKNNNNFEKLNYIDVFDLQTLSIAYYYQNPMGEFMQKFSTDLDMNVVNYILKCDPELNGHDSIYDKAM